jgi:hypothetical protein
MQHTFVVEAVDTIDAGTFVVAAKNEEIFWIFDLVREQQANRFQGLFSTIDVVAQEQVICFWREAAIFKEP